jgi:hypothetical protein
MNEGLDIHRSITVQPDAIFEPLCPKRARNDRKTASLTFLTSKEDR